MKKYNLFVSLLAFLSLSLISCSEGRKLEDGQNIVINEIMTSNRTGLLSAKGKTHDWIELKNTSGDSISLEGFQLAVIKLEPDSIIKDAKNINKNSDTDEESEENLEKADTQEMYWSFPDVKIGPGECMIVFADKKKEKAEGEKKDKSEKKADKAKDPNKILKADLKLPKEGGTLQFLSPGGTVIKEVKYGKMAPDQALALQTDGTYAPTFMQSPGFENTPAGYEAAQEVMADQRQDPLKIWEVMSRAEHSYENWVEIKNTGNSEIDLSAYALSKKNTKKDVWNLPERKLQPGEIITIQLAGKHARNPLDAPFKMGNAETVILSKDGKFVDGVCAKNTLIGGSIGRLNGKKGFFYFSEPSKGAENSASGKRFIADAPLFDKKPGPYPKQDKLTLRLKNPAQKVHYTLDGSLPTSDSPVLKDSIVLNKATVVRAFAEGDSTSLRSRTATASYLLGADHDMPVINIAVNRGDLYDYNTGIYAEGPGYTPQWPHSGANYFKKWTRRAYVEFFDNKEGNQGFATDCGLMIFGGFSRFEAKKSFRLKFRGKYGNSEMEYDFFGNGQPLELEDMVLRSGSQDWNRCMVRDEFFTSLLKAESPELLTQIYRPVALYINGEYFGLYYIREKIDKNFVARQLKLPTNDSINIIMSRGYNEEGSSIPYNQLMQYVSSHDMSNPEHYKYMKDNVDLQGLIDYKLGEIYSGNTDVGNIRYVRSTAPGSDRKWHFVFYDLDASWVGMKPSPEFYLSTGPVASNAGVAVHNVMINRLLANKEFRELFLQRLSHHMKTTFSPKNATAVFDNLVNQIKPEMKRNCERWPQLSYEKWEKNIEDFRAKFNDKPKVMLDGIRDYLHVTDAENKKYFSNLGY